MGENEDSSSDSQPASGHEELKQTSGRQQALNATNRSLKPQETVEEIQVNSKKKFKKIPNYMKPNAAWLGRND